MVSRRLARGGALAASPRKAVTGRLTPRRLRKSEQWPAMPTPPPAVHGLRVIKSFAWGGVTYYEGAVVSPDDQLVRAIHAEYPEYLQQAR